MNSPAIAVDFKPVIRRTYEESTMQFLLLIYDQEKRWTKLGEAEQSAENQEYGAFGKDLRKRSKTVTPYSLPLRQKPCGFETAGA